MGVIVTLVGLAIGMVVGSLAPLSIPQIYSKYFAVALLAALDTGFGGMRSGLEESSAWPPSSVASRPTH